MNDCLPRLGSPGTLVLRRFLLGLGGVRLGIGGLLIGLHQLLDRMAATTADPRLDAFPRQALHAWQLGLIHPRNGEACRWQSPLPADFDALLRTLRGEA